MFKSKGQLLRSSVEMLSQVGVQLSRDPISTMEKISTKLDGRLGTRCMRLLLTPATSLKSEARLFFDAGRLYEIRKARTTSIIQVLEKAALIRAAEFQLSLLTMPIFDSMSRDDFRGEERSLYVLTSSLPYTQSGYTVRSHYLLRSLIDAGLQTEAITRFGYPSSIGTLTRYRQQEIDGIRYNLNSHWLSSRTANRQIRLAVDGLVNTAREYKATVLHTTTDFKNAIVVSRAAKQLGIPWVYEVRGELEQTWLARAQGEQIASAASSEYFLLAKEQERKARKAAAAVFVISEQIRASVLREGIPASKLILLPNGIESIELLPESRSDVIRTIPRLSKATTIVGTVSAIVEYEGLDTLIRSLAYLPDGVHVLIVGEGENKPKLEKLVQYLGLQDRVHFAGKKPMSSIRDWYRALDIFVVPRQDSELCRRVTPIKAMQAQALGIPVIASDLPALREVTGGFAEYIQPENPEALAGAVEKVIARLNEPTVFSDSFIEWLDSRTWDANARKIIETLRNI